MHKIKLNEETCKVNTKKLNVIKCIEDNDDNIEGLNYKKKFKNDKKTRISCTL